MTEQRHSGKAAMVTGGASGIGRGCVERLAAEGADVMIADVADADEAIAACADLPGRVQAVSCDVTDEQAVSDAVSATVDAFGSLDISVNNAGIVFVAPIVDSKVADWRRLMDVNVIGVYLGTRAAAQQMIEQGRGGVIVNASSGGGRHGVPNFAHYCASKAAVIMLSQSAAIELAPHKIRVNCYTPGHIKTPFWRDIASGYAEVAGITEDEAIAAFEDTVPWGRFGTPEDVAGAVSWLASDDAEYVSGQCIAMNGAELPW
ncbi:MAG: SDR family oxidoreductase [Acidimicrobiia bacterium]|nr:SDR family oxidoreductase [Acidimicrobiia bacterium]